MAQWRSVTDLPAEPSAVSCARSVARALVQAWGFPELAEDAQLVISELLTNVIKHAAGTLTVQLVVTGLDNGIRLALSDGSPRRPSVKNVPPDRPNGRGMMLVEALATRWGAETDGVGKTVWAELGR